MNNKGGVELGLKLRALRLDRRWTLEVASKATGVAKATLSKIENATMSPTYDLLQKITAGFEIDLVDLFEPSGHQPPAGRLTVTRNGQGKFLDGKSYGYELLSTELISKRFLPFKARIGARSRKELGELYKHQGEEFIIVLSGSVTVYTEFYGPQVLEVGDAVYFDSQMGHGVISNGDEVAEVLWISSDLTFG